ncbi:MAG: hypothetical protein ACSHYC_21980 [Alphaproteobacteria bacterium]
MDLSDLSSLSSKEKIEIVRVSTFELFGNNHQFTVSDLGAFYIQISMLEMMSEIYLTSPDSLGDDVTRKRNIAIVHCFILSAYLIKEPYSAIRNSDFYFANKDGIPAYLIAADHLKLAAQNLAKQTKNTNNKVDGKFVEAAQRRLETYLKLAQQIEKEPDQIASDTQRNANLFVNGSVWRVRLGFAYPVPIYLCLKIEADKPNRYFYNVTSDEMFGIHKIVERLPKKDLPEYLDKFGRN